MKSFAARLAKFVNPAPEQADPEDEIKSGSSSDSESENEEARAHYVEVGKSRLRDDQPELDSKYVAKVVSRGGESEDESEGESEGEESEAEVDASEVDESDESAQSEASAESAKETQNKSNTVPRSQVSRLLAQEQKQLLSRLSSAANDDAAKGQAVCAQIKSYEQLLDSRITLQKALVASHEPVENPKQAMDAVCELLVSIQNARSRLSGSSKQYTKRKFEEMAADSFELDAELAKRREVTLSKWSRKVQLSNANLQASNFKSLNQSTARQVETVLADMDRLVERTRVNRSKYKVAGEVPETSEAIFDDTDFYRTLLTDLIDRRMAEKDATDSLKWTVAKAAKQKSRKKMDTSLSKNRKLNYEVHNKIVAFDAPRPGVYSWSEGQADELFSGLLGVKITMDDEEPEMEVDEPEDVENFNLFG